MGKGVGGLRGGSGSRLEGEWLTILEGEGKEVDRLLLGRAGGGLGGAGIGARWDGSGCRIRDRYLDVTRALGL